MGVKGANGHIMKKGLEVPPSGLQNGGPVEGIGLLGKVCDQVVEASARPDYILTHG